MTHPAPNDLALRELAARAGNDALTIALLNQRIAHLEARLAEAASVSVEQAAQ